MTSPEAVLQRIKRESLVAALRGAFPPVTALRTAEALIGAGITTIELTMNSAQPLEAMQAVKRAFGDDAAVGMGTVLNAATAAQAIEAGADFIVSPAFDPGMLAAGRTAGVLAIPGVLTPSEAVAAHAAGAPLLKVFPVGPLGVDYFKALRAPLDHIPMLANGGTTDANVGAFIRAGAVGCGMANWLSGDGTWPPDEIARRARLLVDIAAAARRGEPPLQRA